MVSASHLRAAADWVERCQWGILRADDPRPVQHELGKYGKYHWWAPARLQGVCALGMVALLAYGKPSLGQGGSTKHAIRQMAGADALLGEYLQSVYCAWDSSQHARTAALLRAAADRLDPPVRIVPEQKALAHA